jgi:NADH:ubiquinone reductase (H+-translocating)
MANKKIIILGAGFAGLQLARRIKQTGCDITLIDQYNFHQFQPLFYQVAAARLEPSAISFPLRKVFQGRENVHVRIAKVEGVDLKQQLVLTDEGNFDYDYLVIATGATSNFFGNKNFEKYTFPMKSTTEAIALRNRILVDFEKVLSAKKHDGNEEALMNFVIVGGGPTGVELAGALSEMKENILPKDYPDTDFSKLTIYLIEGLPHTLQAMSEASQRKSQQYLEEMGVKLWLNAMVQDYDGTTLSVKDGRTITSHNVIWTAGVMGNVPPGIPKELIVRGNRIKVDHYNKVSGYDNVFAIGDIAYMETPGYPKGHPQLANVAINQAKNLAANMKAIIYNRQLKEFKYSNPGTMATVGKRKAVVDLPKFSFQGRLAWLTWMFLHLMLILSVKNKLIIFINWAISYFTNDTTLRLILLPTKKEIELTEEEQKVEEPPHIVGTKQPAASQ